MTDRPTPKASVTDVAMASEAASEAVAHHVHGLLGALGVAPRHDRRIDRVFQRLTSGTAVEPRDLLRARRSHAAVDEAVHVHDIAFFSLCERYFLPFFGHVSVAYRPGTWCVDAETITAAIDALSHRLQTQERLTRQIRRLLEDVLAPRAVSVQLTAQHTALLLMSPEKNHATLTTKSSSGHVNHHHNTTEITP